MFSCKTEPTPIPINIAKRTNGTLDVPFDKVVSKLGIQFVKSNANLLNVRLY